MSARIRAAVALCLLLAPTAEAACSGSHPLPAGAGVASWYGAEHGGRHTASGERYDPAGLTAAHNSLPFGTMLNVTDIVTGRTVMVRVNDRGPGHGRLIDLSEEAARQLGTRACGLAHVTIRQVTTEQIASAN